MFRLNKVPKGRIEFVNTQIEDNKVDISRLAVVDQFMSKDFCQNEAGWIRSDIAALAAAQTKEQYDAIAARLMQLQGEYSMKDKDSIADGIRLIRPRYAQTPTELIGFAEAVASGDIKSLEKLKAAESAKDNDKKVVEQVVDSPSPEFKSE